MSHNQAGLRSEKNSKRCGPAIAAKDTHQLQTFNPPSTTFKGEKCFPARRPSSLKLQDAILCCVESNHRVELSLVAYRLASREFSETGLFDPSYKGEETRIPS